MASGGGKNIVLIVIAIGAKMLVSLIALTGFTPYLLNLTEQAELSDVGIILSIVVLFLFLGMFLDSIGIILIAVPITAPLVETLGAVADELLIGQPFVQNHPGHSVQQGDVSAGAWTQP